MESYNTRRMITETGLRAIGTVPIVSPNGCTKDELDPIIYIKMEQ